MLFLVEAMTLVGDGDAFFVLFYWQLMAVTAAVAVSTGKSHKQYKFNRKSKFLSLMTRVRG